MICKTESGNNNNRFAVAASPLETVSQSMIVGYIPRIISRMYWYFLIHEGSILCEVVGTRRHSSDLLQGGLEIPCFLHFWHEDKHIIQTLRNTIVNQL